MTAIEKTTVTALDRILVIDPDQLMQKVIAGYVRGMGARKVDDCTDGDMALAKAQSETYDLIVLDWKLKKPPGAALYAAIRQQASTAATPIILVAGFITKEDIGAIAGDKNTKFIVKPFVEEVFLSVVNSVTGSNFKMGKGSSSDMYMSKNEAVKQDSSSSIFKSEGAGNLGIEVHKGSGNQANSGISVDKNSRLANGGNMIQKGESQEEFSILQSKNGLIGGEDIRIAKNGSSNDFAASEKQVIGQGFSVAQERQSSNSFSGEFSKDSNNEGFSFTHNGGTLGSEFNATQKTLSPQITEGKIYGGSDSRMQRIENTTHGQDRIPEGAESKLVEPPIHPLGAPLTSEIILGMAVHVSAPMSAFIIDPDHASQNLFKNYLKQIGTTDVEVFDDGDSAWAVLKQKPTALIVMDWKLKGISGLCLYNRIRTRVETKHIPVIVVSGFVHKEDFRILEESRITKFMEKPFRAKDFDQTVKDVLKSTITQDQIANILQSAVDASLGREENIISLIEDVLKNVPDGLQIIIAAGQYILAKKYYSTAEKIFKIAIRLDPKSVTALTELAKVYHLQKRPIDALHLLTKANNFSPENIERLCMLGEVGLNLQKTDEARAYFKRALDIDQNNATAQAGTIIANNLSDHLHANNNGKPLNMKLASTMNLVGVTYIRNRNYTKGIEQYEAAMCFVHDSSVLAKLQFNLAMAYLRTGDRTKALLWFRTAESNADSDFTKPKQYCQTLESTDQNNRFDDILDGEEEEDLTNENVQSDLSLKYGKMGIKRV